LERGTARFETIDTSEAAARTRDVRGIAAFSALDSSG
jgi:hypothetical protein